MKGKAFFARIVAVAFLAPTLAACGGSAASTATPAATPTNALRPTTAASSAVASATVAPTVAPTTGAARSPAIATSAPATVPPSVASGTGVSGTAAAGSATTGQASGNRVVAAYNFPDVSLATVQNAVLTGSIANDRKVFSGSFGSDLWHGPNDGPNEFWMVGDRGPNGQIKVGDETRRTFPVPEYDPTIVHVQVENGAVKIVQIIPIVGQSGKAVTGLSNLKERDEVPYDYAAKNALNYNVNGLDTEGIVRTAAGDFWLIEEYGPSIVHADATGKVIKRYVPEGLNYSGADYPVAPTLPAIFGKRRQNRGFEGVTLSADAKTLFIILQSPLLNPDAKTGNASRNTRVLAWDIATEKATAEYVYRFSTPAEFGDPGTNKQEDLGSSTIRTVNATTLIVEERTDPIAKLYLVDLTTATNILGTKWDDAANAPTLESLADPVTSGVTVLPKTLLIDLSTLPGVPRKIEGVSVLDKNTIAIANDNDFRVGDFDADGNLIPSGSPTRLIIIGLAKPLP